MFAVIFEVKLNPEQSDTYLEQAGILRPELEKIEGFIDNERYRDRVDEGTLLSLSRWQDEKAVVRWRTKGIHHKSQAMGRGGVFLDYHLRVGEFVDDHASRIDETEIGPSKAITLSEAPADVELAAPSDKAALESRWFTSLNEPHRTILLVSWSDAAAASGWKPHPKASHGIVRVLRDYGMQDRREAPQYYPPVDRQVSHPKGAQS